VTNAFAVEFEVLRSSSVDNIMIIHINTVI